MALSLVAVFIMHLLLILKAATKHHFHSIYTHKWVGVSSLLFILICIFSSLNSLDYLFSLKEAMRISVIIICGFIMLSYAHSVPRINHRWLILGYGIALLLCIEEYLLWGVLYNLVHGLPLKGGTLFLVNLNRGMCFLAIMMWVIFASQYGYKSYMTLILTAFIILIYESESAKLGVIVGISTYIVARICNKNFGIVFQIACIATAIFIPLIIYHLIYNHELYFITKYFPWSFEHRLYIWQNVLDLICLKPIFGYGMGASRVLANLGLSEMVIHNNITISLLPIHPHNGILQILLELGILGLVLYIFLWLTIIRSVSRSESFDARSKAITYAIIATYLTTSQSSFDIWISWWLCQIFIVGYYLLSMSKSK